MKNIADRFGMIIAIAVTATAIAFVSTISDPENRNLQPQGQDVIERTTSALTKIPKAATDTLYDTASNLKEIPSEVADVIDDAKSIPEKSVDKITDAIPEVPDVVKQSEGKLLTMISIPKDTAAPGCEENNSCYLPETTSVKKGSEIIWENKDIAAHTVTSGTAVSGPNGLFDSGLIYPGDTYSIKLDLANEYVYFCQVHPWMTGSIVVK